MKDVKRWLPGALISLLLIAAILYFVDLGAMLDSLRDWLKRFRSPTASPTAHSATTGDAARQQRASRVAALRNDVSRLQQEILTLSNALDGHTGGDAHQAGRERLVALERQLTETQQALAKLQGRI